MIDRGAVSWPASREFWRGKSFVVSDGRSRAARFRRTYPHSTTAATSGTHSKAHGTFGVVSMDFSSLPVESVAGRVLRLTLKIIPSGTVLRIVQGPLLGKKWIAGSSNHGCWLGSYEFSKQRLFARIVQPGWTVFDVGAHVGFYTLLSSILVGPEGAVLAFEPLPRNAFLLRKHLHINTVRNATVIEAAVADYCGTARFVTARSTSTGRLDARGALDVGGVTLYSLYEAGAPMPNCLKIDIEGGGYLALRGAQRLLSEQHPVVFLATHGPDVDAKCAEVL